MRGQEGCRWIAVIAAAAPPAGSAWAQTVEDLRRSHDTLGGVADRKAGPLDRVGLLRHGGRIGERGTYRVYGGLTHAPTGRCARHVETVTPGSPIRFPDRGVCLGPRWTS